MNITINTIYNKPIDIDIDPSLSIGYLKSIIQDNFGVHPDCIYLYYNNILLNDTKLLYYYDIKSNDIIEQSDRIKY